jgi:tetratricopeptide (TPR) repeat protein
LQRARARRAATRAARRGERADAAGRYSQHKFRAHYNRGNCYRKLHRLHESVADLEAAVVRRNATRRAMALTAQEWGAIDASIALYERALELYGVNADADATRSKMKAISERTQARMAELRQQSALMPPMQKSPSRGPLAATSARGPLP